MKLIIHDMPKYVQETIKSLSENIMESAVVSYDKEKCIAQISIPKNQLNAEDLKLLSNNHFFIGMKPSENGTRIVLEFIVY